MKLKVSLLFSFLLILFISGCNDDNSSELPSVEERVDEALEELRDELTSPANGWEVRYSPTDESGFFLMLLDFSDDGTVRIQSDVPGDDGAYGDQELSYRLDYALHLELIFETYGAFHYLFEQDEATFGAEFEFLYSGKDGDNLIFESKSDLTDPTIITFTPAAANASEAFSREVSENMQVFYPIGPFINFFGTGTPNVRQQMYIADRDVSIFWAIDIEKRFLIADVAGVGSSIEEIEANNSKTSIAHSTGIGYLDGAMVLQEPLEFSLDGNEYSISEINLTTLTSGGPAFCSLFPISTPIYNGSIDGIGAIQIFKSLYTSAGDRFQPRSSSPYSINAVFIFDEQVNSLLEEGSLGESFPNALVFVWSYGYSDDTFSEYSLGFIIEEEDGSRKTYLREYEPTETNGNRVTITLTDNYIFSEDPEDGDQEALEQITDEIFIGNQLYAYHFTIDGLDIIRLYNPCNDYEVLLVE